MFLVTYKCGSTVVHLGLSRPNCCCTMAKHWNTATLVTLALLGCFIGTEVEAQGWQKPATPTKKGYQPPQPPTFPQNPKQPQVSPPQPPTFPQNPKQPQVSPPQPPTFPKWPKQPQVSPPQPPTFPKWPKQPQVSPPQPPTFPQRFHDQSPQEPQIPRFKQQQQSSSIYKPSGAKQPPVQSCEVASNMRVPCGHNDISAAGCEAINCCFSGQQCYFGKAGEFLKRLAFT